MHTIGPFKTLPGMAHWLNSQEDPQGIVTAALIEYRFNHRLTEHNTCQEAIEHYRPGNSAAIDGADAVNLWTGGTK